MTVTIERTVTISPDATFEDLYQLTLADWQYMPTIYSGHFDNLKYESATFRVWVSRASRADYDSAEAHAKERLRIEKCVNGCWLLLDRYGRVEAT